MEKKTCMWFCDKTERGPLAWPSSLKRKTGGRRVCKVLERVANLAEPTASTKMAKGLLANGVPFTI